MDLSLANHHRNNVLRLSKALCCSLWLSVNTATSANLPWFIFTGFKDNLSFPDEQPHSSFPKGSALDGRPCPQSPSLDRGRPLALGPSAPLKGQATNPSRHFRSSSQSHSTLTRTPVSEGLPQAYLRDQTTLCGFPAIIWLARPTLLLALARRHNQPLIFQFPLQPGSLQPSLSSTLARRITGCRPTTPHTVVSLRSPGDRLRISRPQQTQ